MKYYDDLKDMLCVELKEIADKGVIGAGDLEPLYKMTTIIKNIYKIEMLESEGEYSRQESYRRGYSRADSYDGGYSGMHYVRGHYSRDDANMRMIDELRQLMQSGNLSPKQHQAIQGAMDALK